MSAGDLGSVHGTLASPPACCLWDLALLEQQSRITSGIWGRDGTWVRPTLGSDSACDWQRRSGRRAKPGDTAEFSRLTFGKRRTNACTCDAV